MEIFGNNSGVTPPPWGIMWAMGIRQTLAGMAWADGQTGKGYQSSSYARRGRVVAHSPWAEGTLAPVLAADVFGLTFPGVSRSMAMTIPGVARARGILLSLIADKPLVLYRGKDRAPDDAQPSWLYNAPDLAGPTERMAQTVDDHIFYPWSLWGCRRGEAAAGLRPILSAWHISYDDWEVDPAGRICVRDEDGQMTPADADEVILIPGPWDGLLAHGSRTVTGAAELETAWIARAKNPIPAIELHETAPTDMDDDEAAAFVKAWGVARSDPDGAVAFTPYNIQANALGQYAPEMFTEARNAARLDLAAFFQLPGSLLDASTATASLTYVTQQGQASSLDAMTVPYWVRLIEGRLSQDDVVPRGSTLRFSWAEAYTEPQGRIVTDAAAIRDTATTSEVQR